MDKPYVDQYQIKFINHHRKIVLGLGPGNELGPSPDLASSVSWTWSWTKFQSWIRSFGLNPGPGPALCLRPSGNPSDLYPRHVLDIPMSDIKASYRVNDLQDCDSGFYMIVDLAKSPWWQKTPKKYISDIQNPRWKNAQKNKWILAAQIFSSWEMHFSVFFYLFFSRF